MNVGAQMFGLASLLAATAAADMRTSVVDVTAKGRVLPNPSQMLTSWSVPKTVDPSSLEGIEWNVRENVRPPDDYAAYARYMAACARALTVAFGKDELLKWRYAAGQLGGVPGAAA